MAKCPHCDSTVSHFQLDHVSASLRFEGGIEVILFCCPSCHKILSAQIDPLQIKNEIVSAINQNRR
jgi:hypothetical protein